VGSFALHIQCPWRIVATDRIITGSTDYYQPPSEGADVNEDDPLHGNLQRLHLRQLLGGYDPETRSLINEQNRLVVEAVHADRYGGIGLDLSDSASKYFQTEQTPKIGGSSHRVTKTTLSLPEAKLSADVEYAGSSVR
jgi:hypothetical protein